MEVLQSISPFSCVVLVSVLLALLIKRTFAERVVAQWQQLSQEQQQIAVPETIFLLRKYEAYFTVFCLLAIFAMPFVLIKFKTGFMIFVFQLAGNVALMLLSSLDASLREKKLRGTTASTFEYSKEIILGFALCIAGQIAIWFSFWIFGKMEGIVAEALPWQPLFPTITSYAIFFIKIVFSFFIFFLFYPYLLKLSLQLKDPDDQEIVTMIKGAVARTKFRSPKIWFLNYDKFKVFNAMVWINPFFGRYSQPVIIISRTLCSALKKDEIEAIISHELSHLELNHIQKRIFVLLMTIIFLVGFGISLKIVLLVAPFIWIFLLIASKILSLLVPIVVLSRLVRVQELQADAYAVFRLGAKAESLKTALEKIYDLNQMVKNKRDPLSYFSAASAHPTLEFRKESLEVMRNRIESGAPFFQWTDYITGDFRPVSKLQRFASFGTLGVASLLLLATSVYSSNTNTDDWLNAESEEATEGEYGLKGAPALAREWIAALESNDDSMLTNLIKDENAREIFKDPVWGKIVFFTATDSSMKNLEAILNGVNVPLENIEHAIPRAQSQKNDSVSARLVQFRKSKALDNRNSASVE